MSLDLFQELRAHLLLRKRNHLLRELPRHENENENENSDESNHLVKQRKPQIDFFSNDYIGIAQSSYFHERALQLLAQNFHGSKQILGSTGARLISGSSSFIQKLETDLASFHNAQSALLFNSGFDANVALFESVPQPQDWIVYDEYIHASMHQGIRLSRTSIDHRIPFKHNDVQDLSSNIFRIIDELKNSGKINQCPTILVAVESIYSMDGDLAPLGQILDICSSFTFKGFSPSLKSKGFRPKVVLIVDEAHAGGLFGNQGQGRTVALNLQDHSLLYARTITFGKAWGSQGAIVLGNEVLTQYLKNYAKTWIYTTALPPYTLCALRAVLEDFRASTSRSSIQRAALVTLSEYYDFKSSMVLPHQSLIKNSAKDDSEIDLKQDTFSMNKQPNTRTENGIMLRHIKAIMVPGNELCLKIAADLDQRFHCKVHAVRSPTVPRGLERLRVTLHSFNSPEEIDYLLNCFLKCWNEQQISNHISPRMSKL